MGNHDVGRSMAASAEVFWATMDAVNAKPTKEQALSVLDIAAKNFHGADAEFDDEFFGETPLSKLVALAFDATPEEIDDRDNSTHEGELWYEGPYRRFSNRYRFC